MSNVKRSASERSALASIAANERWMKCKNRTEATEPARRGLEEKFERDVDPEGLMSPADRAKAVQNAKKAYYTRLALKSAEARRKKAA